MTYSVKVDGKPVPFTPGVRYSWVLSMGAGAPLQVWELPVDMVDQLLATRLGQEITLELNDVKIERVLVLGNAPSGNDQTELVIFADVRWYWTRLWLSRDYNVRRRAGDTRLVGDGPLEAQTVVPDVQYFPYSINSGKEGWHWKDSSRDVLDAATGNAARAIQYVVDSALLQASDGIITETLIDDQMPTGVSRALAALPGRSLYVDLAGVVHVADNMPGAEDELVQRLPKALILHGALVKANQAAHRPKDGYDVLFNLEYEVLFVFDSQATSFSSDQPYLENVLVSPDVQLDVPAVQGGTARTVGTGSYLTHPEAYAAWGAPDVAPLEHQPGPLTEEVVRANYLGPLLFANYVQRFSTELDALWLPRIEETLNTYRVLFRVNPDFWAGVKSARAVRAVLADVENGTRAPSPVYANTARKFSLRSLAAGVTKVGFSDELSYPSSGLLRDGTPARANIYLRDPEQGILEAVFKKPRWGDTLEIAPSALEDEPDLDPSKDPLYRSFSWPTRKLAAAHKLATILSCVPAGPNDTSKYFSVHVSLQEAYAGLFPASSSTTSSAGGGLPEAVGPRQTLRCRVTNARVPWPDDPEKNLTNVAPFTPFSTVAQDEGLATDVDPVNYALELKPAAIASAAQHLVARLDHWQGRFRVPLDKTIVPLGSAGVVVHSVSGATAATAEAVTAIEALAPQAYIDFRALLPASTRKVLDREVQP